MSRPLRVELAGGLYHVTSRGDRREDIFLDDGDRLLWLDIFAETCLRFNWRCHAWCQMSNHYHVVLETVEGNLSAGMRYLNGVYKATGAIRATTLGRKGNELHGPQQRKRWPTIFDDRAISRVFGSRCFDEGLLMGDPGFPVIDNRPTA